MRTPFQVKTLALCIRIFAKDLWTVVTHAFHTSAFHDQIEPSVHVAVLNSTYTAAED